MSNDSCKRCHIEIIDIGSNFCPACGTPLKNNKKFNDNKDVNLTIAFYIANLAFLCISFLIFQDGTNLVKEIVIELLFIFLTIGFSLTNIKSIWPLYRVPKLNPLFLVGIIIVPFCTALIVYYGTGFINTFLFNWESNNVFLEYADYPNSFLWAFICIAIFPAVFEELAFRGFLFNLLHKSVSVKATIILTAFLFALIHLSFISILWIFPFGLLLGYLRYKYKTLWLGMIIHFLHNLIILSLDFYNYSEYLETDFW